jgi:hypothetical protein
MRVRRLAICADDFALSEPVSRGILDLAGRGRLTAIAAMTAGARWPQAWQHLREIPEGVALGLHLNFVEGVGLADGRPLPGAAWLAARTATLSMPRKALAREIAAQWQAFEDLAGRAPDFVDSHRHVHVLPPLRELVLDAVARHGGGIVVRKSIILVDFIELRVREGMPLSEAVIDAGAVRLRPMLLTAMAVVVGAAVILADPIFQGLAIALMAGEIASLLISRMAVPVLYFMANQHSHPEPKPL